MAWSFGDSFDFYAKAIDCYPFYWDTGQPFFNVVSAGRFSGHAMGSSAQSWYVVKNSNVNDPVHHIVFSFWTLASLTDTPADTIYFQLNDGATPQCTVTISSNGSFRLQAGAFGGTGGTGSGLVLATSPQLIIQTSVWYSFEVEIVISNTNGSFTIRKNGNNLNDFSIAGLDTQGSANAYANSLTVGSGGYAWSMDDLFWQSGAATGNWLGDIRCYVRMPITDAAVQFQKVPSNILVTASTPATNTSSLLANIIYATLVTSTISGNVVSLVATFNAAIVGNVTMAIYDSTGTGGGPGNLIAQSAQITNPNAGSNTFIISSPPTVLDNISYHVAIWTNVAFVSQGNAVTTRTLTVSYTGTFPATMVGFGATTVFVGNMGMNIAPSNAGCVGDTPQDTYTTYVWDNVPGHADFYNIAPIPATPAVVYAVTTRAFGIKSDAGTRTFDVQLKSGGTTVVSPTIVLTTSLWQWAWRMDVTNPDTGGAWTAATVNNVQIGPKVIA